MKKQYLVPQMVVYDFKGESLMESFSSSESSGVDQNQFMVGGRVVGINVMYI